MKIYLPLFLWLCVLQSTGQIQMAGFPWPQSDFTLTNHQKLSLDSIYMDLAPGEKIKLEVLHANEKVLDKVTKAQLSYKRAQAMLEFCFQQQYPENDFYAEMVPFDAPHVVKSNQLTTHGYKSFMSTKSISYLVLVKTVPKITSQPSVTFDATIGDEKQMFTVNTNRAIDITLAQGTRIYIPANSLQYANGTPAGCDQAVLIAAEYLEMEAMAMKAMTTSSYNKKLQTGGMWYIVVQCNGQNLVMKPGKKYSISVSFEGERKDMRVFTGQDNKGMLNWKEETDDRVIKPIENISNEKEIKYDDEGGIIDESYSGDSSTWGENYEAMMNDGVYVSEDGNRYDLELNNFGWINCDAFDYNVEKTDVLVYGDLKGANVMLVYPKRKSVLPGYVCSDNLTVQFSNVAIDETALLVVFRPTKDKSKVEKFTRLIDPENQKRVKVKTEMGTLEELRADIKGGLSDL